MYVFSSITQICDILCVKIYKHLMVLNNETIFISQSLKKNTCQWLQKASKFTKILKFELHTSNKWILHI